MATKGARFSSLKIEVRKSDRCNNKEFGAFAARIFYYSLIAPRCSLCSSNGVIKGIKKMRILETNEQEVHRYGPIGKHPLQS
jgi:hypothetical protein